MASRSPVVLESSSPEAYRILSATPQSLRKQSSVTESSPPGLPSPSTFIRPLAPGLKSGSRAQQAPQGVVTGFASAASLFRTHQFQAGAETGHEKSVPISETYAGNKGTEKPKESAGKLAKPRKVQKAAAGANERTVDTPSPLRDFAYRDSSAKWTAKSESPVSARYALREAPNKAPAQPKERKPSVALSQYDFRPEDAPEHLPHSAKETVKRRRKRAAKPKEQAVDAPIKQPRKRMAKSEPIILNSGEPDPVETEAAATQREAVVLQKAAPSLDVSAPKTRKTSKKPKAAELETSSKTVDISSCAAPGRDGPPASPDKHEASTFFAKGENAAETCNPSVINLDSPAAPLVEDAAQEGATTPLPAPRRRLSWTTANNTVALPAERPGTADSAASSESQAPKMSLTALVSGFGFANSQAPMAPPARTTSGEALTKRRRIELTDAATMALNVWKAFAEPVEKPKKVKAPKKKPQTITALATKAYQAAEDPVTGQATVSSFFAPGQQPHQAPENATNEANEAAAKPKKPRKPRVKKVNVEPSVPKPANTTKPKKAKVKINEADYIAKLYTPQQARAVEKSQDFLFGTSSQLAVEESPTFVREMQLSIRESEAISTLHVQTSPYGKIKLKATTAPHGTSLSVAKADRDLWCTAARDEEGDVLEAEKAPNAAAPLVAPPSPVSHLVEVEPNASDAMPAELNCGELHSGRLLEPSPEHNQVEGHGLAIPGTTLYMDPGEDHAREVVDLCQTSPLAVEDEAPALQRNLLVEPGQVTDASGGAKDKAAENVTESTLQASDDSWMLIRSDDSTPDRAQAPITKAAVNTAGIPLPPLKRSATSPNRQRTVLQALDANIGPLAHTSPRKDISMSSQRAFTSGASPSRQNMPRGRPRRDAASTKAAPESPKPRSRPPKKIALVPEPALSATSASQPAPASQWLNIDDIDESDSPATPSPPRRRATSSPPAIQPLDLEVTASPSLKAKAPAALISTFKAGDANWPSIMATLFPQITATVRSTTPSIDMAKPTWHEKILLYDPIVLEDLTAWLNEQGLRVETRRLKPKPKTKGRKKKDAGPAPDESEYKTVQEELKPWMVQKWCEEKSICCLWKEGLRGGVRNGY